LGILLSEQRTNPEQRKKMTTIRHENTAATITPLADGFFRAKVFVNARGIADQDLAGHPAADLIAMREFKTERGALNWARRQGVEGE
jgi:hypothetical protein